LYDGRRDLALDADNGDKWEQVNLAARTVTVGLSKTEAGAGRVIPLNAHALSIPELLGGFIPEPCTALTPQSRLAYGKKRCKRRRFALASSAAFTTSVTPDARECSKRACHFQWLR
jgi:hypothetical protein